VTVREEMENQTVNIYCDESCHMLRDRVPIMSLGAITAPKELTRPLSLRIRNLKSKYQCNGELKWTKVSPAKLGLYVKVLEYFWDCDDLCFRALVVPDKSLLDYPSYFQTHDNWYYKMYFTMLKTIIQPNNCYNIYIDLKDTRGATKTSKLHKVLCNSHYDFDRDIIRKIQQVRSHEVELLQMTDIFVGALSYLHRGLSKSHAKIELISHLKRITGMKLNVSSLPSARKFNLFIWRPTESMLND